MTRYRLVVYPPGISRTERRRVRVARGFPLWGSAVWIVAQIYLSDVFNPWIALALSISVVLTLGWVARAMAAPMLEQTRTMSAAVMVGLPELGSTAERDQLQRLGIQLIRADESLADRALTEIEHESIWWNAYDEIGSDRGRDQPGAQHSGRSAR